MPCCLTLHNTPPPPRAHPQLQLRELFIATCLCSLLSRIISPRSFNYVNEVNAEVEKLEDQTAVIRGDIGRYRDGGADLDRAKSGAVRGGAAVNAVCFHCDVLDCCSAQLALRPAAPVWRGRACLLAGCHQGMWRVFRVLERF